jgi:uncharacterized protein
MSTGFEISDLHNELARRDELLGANNASARDTSMLSRERFDRLISTAHVALHAS